MDLITPHELLILGNIVAAIAIPHGEGYLPQRHIIVCHRPSQPDGRAYSTHEIAKQPYGWAAVAGHYEMPKDKAMADMLARAGYARMLA